MYISQKMQILCWGPRVPSLKKKKKLLFYRGPLDRGVPPLGGSRGVPGGPGGLGPSRRLGKCFKRRSHGGPPGRGPKPPKKGGERTFFYTPIWDPFLDPLF